MTWKVMYTKSFWKSVEHTLKGLSEKERRRVIKKIEDLAVSLMDTPFPIHLFDLRKVVGKKQTEIRVRIGKYRVIYSVNKLQRTIVLKGFLRRDENAYKA